MRARRRPLARQIKEYQTKPFFLPTRTKYNHLHHPAAIPYTNPGNPGTDPRPEGTRPRVAKGAPWGAPSGPRSVPKLAHSRRWLVSSRKIPPEPCNLLSSAGKKNFTGWH